LPQGAAAESPKKDQILRGKNFVAAMRQVYEIRPHRGKRGVDLISDALPFGRLWYDTPDNAIGYAMHNSRSL
jgi:hypothetical protein